jgi:transcriptional regulator with XRE-family HTH domain
MAWRFKPHEAAAKVYQPEYTLRKEGMQVLKTAGQQLQEARRKKGLSVRAVAKISGLSRKTIDQAEADQNIELQTLKKLASTIGLTELDVGDGLVLRLGTSAEQIADVIETLNRSIALTKSATHKLLSFPAVGKSVQKDSPLDETMVVKAAALIDEFATIVGGARNPQELAKVEKGMVGIRATARGRRRTA